ncbi:MAG: hypothetical protein ACRCXD_06465 [Luteolibacter sp.]
MNAFATTNAGVFSPGSRALAQFAVISGVVAAMEGHGVAKLSGTEDFRGGTDAKAVAAENLRAEMRAIRDTAQAISEAEGLPEFDDQFRMPRSSSFEVLLTTARAFLADATANEALFLEFEIKATFLADLAADIATLEAADDTQDGGLSQQVGGTAELSAEVAKGLAARKQLIPIVKNKYAGNAGVLAEWATATRIVRPERKPKTPPVP